MNENLPPACILESIVHPETHFEEPRNGWYRIWYKTRVAPNWCALRVVGSVAKLSYDRLVNGGQVRNLLIEKITRNHPPYRAGQTHTPPTYTNRERRFLTQRGIG